MCGISREEAEDYFLHFDEKRFENPRLQSNKELCSAFYADPDRLEASVSLLTRLDRDDLRRVERLLEAALPESMCREDRQFTVVLLFSIGNSQGYPWGDSIVFDAAKMDLLADRDALLHVIAHELHHILFPSLLPETLTGQEMYAVGLAAEGLAMHFCNNAQTRYKDRKYPQLPGCGVAEADFALYDRECAALFAEFAADYRRAAGMTAAEAAALLAARYEQPVYTSRLDGSLHRVTQYPVYYLGCFLWGLIDLALGKNVLLHTLKHPVAFARTYNRAAKKLGIPWHLRSM